MSLLPTGSLDDVGRSGGRDVKFQDEVPNRRLHKGSKVYEYGNPASGNPSAPRAALDFLEVFPARPERISSCRRIPRRPHEAGEEWFESDIRYHIE